MLMPLAVPLSETIEAIDCGWSEASPWGIVAPTDRLSVTGAFAAKESALQHQQREAAVAVGKQRHEAAFVVKESALQQQKRKVELDTPGRGVMA